MSIPRPEYPRPQCVRENWMNLNGEWQFEFDPGRSGKARKLQDKCPLERTILVPFCPESRLSGIGDVDFHEAVWYRRSFTLTADQLALGKTLLHFGAVDYECECWVNGQPVGTHVGGFSAFSFDITAAVQEGENTIVLYVEDLTRAGYQPRGKQSVRYESYGCSYTRTTGIWQTVWLEFLPQRHIDQFRVYPSAAAGHIDLQVQTKGDCAGCFIRAAAFFDGSQVGEAGEPVSGDCTTLRIELSERHLWNVGEPNLYDLQIELLDAAPIDAVDSYFGLRDVTLRNGCTYINGRPVFQRLVLDQGFNPEGIYTAPDVDFLKRDHELSMALGFNGARLHQRIFEEHTLYWADKLGYLIWGEYPSWGVDEVTANGVKYFVSEWLEIVKRDFNHPAIIGWCPFNETWNAEQDKAIVPTAYWLTKSLDPTRLVIDTSGGNHFTTDMYDIHDYEQDVEIFRSHYEPMKEGGDEYKGLTTFGKWQGEPYWVSEYGGTWWNPGFKGASWGYGNRPTSEEELGDRYDGLTRVLLDHPMICGFCYTQLTDVEQEQNGLYYYDRSPKFQPEIYEQIRKANTAPAKIEEVCAAKDAACGHTHAEGCSCGCCDHE